MLRRAPHLLKKIKNVREHNFDGGANNSELDKDTDRSNLNSKIEYLSLALPLNILFLLLVFIGFSTCEVRFCISYTIIIIMVQAIVNTLDDCNLLEKVVNRTIVHIKHNVIVSIKVQQFRSRYTKFVYYNRTRVGCECQYGYKSDRELSRIQVRMLERLSQKIRKLQSYVRSRLSKNVPKSSKVHDLIKNNAT